MSKCQRVQREARSDQHVTAKPAVATSTHLEAWKGPKSVQETCRTSKVEQPRSWCFGHVGSPQLRKIGCRRPGPRVSLCPGVVCLGASRADGLQNAPRVGATGDSRAGRWWQWFFVDFSLKVVKLFGGFQRFSSVFRVSGSWDSKWPRSVAFECRYYLALSRPFLPQPLLLFLAHLLHVLFLLFLRRLRSGRSGTTVATSSGSPRRGTLLTLLLPQTSPSRNDALGS